MYRYSLCLFILLVSKITYGQFSMPVTTTMHTPQGNVPFTYYVPTPRMYYGQPRVSVKYKFDIVLKNDSAFSARTKINLADKKDHSITIRDGKIKRTLFPADTKSISRTTFDGEKLIGIPADTCWLFKTYVGRINAYSFVAELGLLYVIAIQDREGPIVPLTKENLLFIVGIDDLKIYKMVQKEKFIQAIEAYNTKK